MPAITSGSTTALYLFDVALAIDLAALATTLGPDAAPATLDDKTAGPSRVRYVQAPVMADGRRFDMPDLDGFRVRVKFYEYGVVSIMLTRAFAGELAGPARARPVAHRERLARESCDRCLPAHRR